MNSHKTFVSRVLSGEIYNLGKIDEEIDLWHQPGTPGADCELHEWLGLTEPEYALFVEKPEALKVILHARKYGSDLFAVLASNDNAVRLAARGADPVEAAEIVAWLQQTGRL